MASTVEGTQSLDQVLLVRRRQQHRHQDDVGNVRCQGGHRGVRRVDQEQLRMHVVADDPLQHGALAGIRFDGEDERHG